jgi:general secretion pathway protein K
VRRARQAGVAAVTAVLIVAVAASAAALMLAQQSATLDQAMMVASRAQADQYAQAGLDWARGVITADPGTVDSLGDGWAQPIPALPVERAIVSGDITDEQGKFNLNNLVVGNNKSPEDIAIFQRLLTSVGLEPALADAVVDWIDADSDISGPGGAEDPYYLALPRPYRAANQPMAQVEELYRVRGFDAKAVAALLPYVTALPATTARTTINVNTADPHVLAAVLPNVPSSAIAQVVAQRATKPFKSADEVAQWAAALDPKASTGALDVKSSYFAVHVRVAQDDIQLATDALVARATTPGQSAATFVWRRPRY